jgi:IS30 family transposase
MHYHHLNLAQRHYIEIEHKRGVFQTEIAKALGINQSTISREIRRNTGKKGYRHQQAESLCQERHQEKPKQVKMTEDVTSIIDRYIREDWSPEQIAGRLKEENIISLHHETIYQYILADKKAGGELYRHLRHQNKKYKKRYGTSHARSQNGIVNRTDIDERPEVADNRERVGDWEGDLIIGKNHKGAIVTLDERKSKLRLAMPTGGKKATKVRDAIIELFNPISDFVKTLTFDNGKEFSCHENMAEKLECDVYFAKPYHSWERGQNENANGLLRQYFPKKMELIDVTKKQVFDAIHKLNSRPRKCLGYRTPYEVFEELTGINQETLTGYALMT